MPCVVLLVAHGWNVQHYFWCMLLGPESPGLLVTCGCLCLWVAGGWGFCRAGCFARGVWVVGYGSYVENYTVDASICNMCLFWVCVVNVSLESGCMLVFLPFGWGLVCGWFLNGSLEIFCFCDFKFLRANGGCLGIWSRRRT